MVSRKKAAGKARRAAKAAKEEEAGGEGGGGGNNNTTDGQQEETTGHRLPAGSFVRLNQFLNKSCRHGLEVSSACFDFVIKFTDEFYAAASRIRNPWIRIRVIHDATKADFADVWNDSAKMKTVISYFLCLATGYVLNGYHTNRARVNATLARYIEQYIAVELHQTQALINVPKIFEAYNADMHTLVKFFRNRIPCSCLDAKYKEVKDITKIGYCHNPQCCIPDGDVERSKTKYCSRCRNVTYCSRECQKVDWTRHKPYCDHEAAMIAKFEAKQQGKVQKVTPDPNYDDLMSLCTRLANLTIE